jgi:hypothetical protein
MTKNIKVTWKAFGNKPERGRFISSVEFEVPGLNEIADVNICEAIYKDTNFYGGLWWNQIESKLSPTRTHTSLSVGDEIEINGQVYICADFGFEKIENVEIKKIEDTIFSVSRKEEVSA